MCCYVYIWCNVHSYTVTNTVLLSAATAATITTASAATAPQLIALGSRSNTSESCQRQVQTLISTHGSRIVVALVGCCTQELPAYALDDGSGSVAGSLWKLALLCRPWLQQWLAAALSAVRESTATAQQRTEFAEALVAPAANRDSVEDAVRRFSSLCWQNSRRWNTAK
eukprot:5832-Heterococcus_DN1.PRE.1